MRINASEHAIANQGMRSIANQGMRSIWCPYYWRSDFAESRSTATTTRE
jgi:hypothetical protein